jgi:hypothetical protein
MLQVIIQQRTSDYWLYQLEPWSIFYTINFLRKHTKQGITQGFQRTKAHLYQQHRAFFNKTAKKPLIHLHVSELFI